MWLGVSSLLALEASVKRPGQLEIELLQAMFTARPLGPEAVGNARPSVAVDPTVAGAAFGMQDGTQASAAGKALA